MLSSTELYYFSPTGGTKKAGETFAKAFADEVKMVDLGKKEIENPNSTVIVAAAPVFAGRIPAAAAEQLKKLQGEGRYAVTLTVYGVRAYDDALLEMNDILTNCGFKVIASAALVAEHSVVREVGAGRPNEEDILQIQEFADQVWNKLENNIDAAVKVPGNYPYRPRMKTAAVPVSASACNLCGTCISICPADAIQMEAGKLQTSIEKCCMCMACVAHCPKKARMLPAPVQEGMNQMLGKLKDVYRENEFFL